MPPSACDETPGVFSNYLFFIVVFSLFSFSEISPVTVIGLSDIISCILISYALFYMLSKVFFARLEKKYSAGRPGSFSSLHGSLINRCTISAVFAYAFFIYVLDIKSAFTAVPLLARSDFVQSFIAVMLFFVFLVIIWICAFPSYRHFFNTGASLRGYVLSQARFNSAIIAPWIIFSLIIDCARLLPPAISSLLTDSTLTGYAFMACVFVAMGVFFPPLLVRLWGCKPIEHGYIRSRLTQFCAQAKFSYAEILEWNLFDGKLITAGVLGFVPWFRYLLISPALLDLLDEQELEAVVAHEIGHVKTASHALLCLVCSGVFFFCLCVFFINF